MRAKSVLAGGVMAAALIFGLETAFDARPPASVGLRVGPPLAAAMSPMDDAMAAVVPRSPDNHFWAETTINGAPVRALVDTGATLVALTRADARRAGLVLEQLVYDHPIETAGGIVNAARIRLDTVMVGGIALDNVEGIVAPDGLGYSLLGMSYLGRLTRLEVTREALTLRQ